MIMMVRNVSSEDGTQHTCRQSQNFEAVRAPTTGSFELVCKYRVRYKTEEP